MTPDTSTESHRHTCEVRHVAALRSDADRQRYLAGVHEKRGKNAWQRLRVDVWTLLQRVA